MTASAACLNSLSSSSHRARLSSSLRSSRGNFHFLGCAFSHSQIKSILPTIPFQGIQDSSSYPFHLIKYWIPLSVSPVGQLSFIDSTSYSGSPLMKIGGGGDTTRWKGSR